MMVLLLLLLYCLMLMWLLPLWLLLRQLRLWFCIVEMGVVSERVPIRRGLGLGY
jgi:hypothetical protein